MEDDKKELYNPDLSEKERVAIQLRIEEQTIAQSTMDAVRRRQVTADALVEPNCIYLRRCVARLINIVLHPSQANNY
jgi:hypothetical protein